MDEQPSVDVSPGTVYVDGEQIEVPGYSTALPVVPAKWRMPWMAAFVTIMVVIIVGIGAGFIGAQSRNGEVKSWKAKTAAADQLVASEAEHVTALQGQVSTAEDRAQTAEDAVISCQAVQPAAEKLISLASTALTTSSDAVGAADVYTLESVLAQINALTPQIQAARADLNDAEVGCS